MALAEKGGDSSPMCVSDVGESIVSNSNILHGAMTSLGHAVPENSVSREVADRNCLISIEPEPRRSSTSGWVLGAPKYLLNSRCGLPALADADSPACLICFSARLTSINGRPQQRHLFTVKGSFSGPCKVCCLNLISFDSLHV